MNQNKTKLLLQDKLNELNKRLEHLNIDISRSHSADFEEQAQERENDEVIDVIAEETEKAIRQIKKALQQIDEGEYGICTECGAEMASERLLAIPESTECTECLQHS